MNHDYDKDTLILTFRASYFRSLSDVDKRFVKARVTVHSSDVSSSPSFKREEVGRMSATLGV